ncbi:HD domain-containing protein [Sunxiuqinia sp. sy24]|uniref:HD domain-containing protein n=1 Tax=Sunxiuqinia sp. sy24 TaxID=3461495 RepID=UPI00404543A6
MKQKIPIFKQANQTICKPKKTNDSIILHASTTPKQHFNQQKHIHLKRIYPQDCGYTSVSFHVRKKTTMMIIENFIKNPDLAASITECEKQITPVLQKYISHFPDYTDHSINHSKIVLNYAIEILDDSIKHLNEDELYILIMSAYLHDIGMSPSIQMQEELKLQNDDLAEEIRKVHHELSFKYILENWKILKIPNKKYATAIGLVCMGHRKVNLFDTEVYKHEYIVKGGKEFVCLPFLAGLLRLADELDITNDRTPELLFNNYYPTEKTSIEEWEKHKSNYFISYNDNKIIITAECSLRNVYYGLLEQKIKIQNVLNEFHKLIHLFPKNKNHLNIRYTQIVQEIETIGFLPKEIGFSFDFQNTFNAFIGKNLYDDNFVAIREVIQNSIDTCLYKTSISKNYNPSISIKLVDSKLIIEDNGMGMDFFIIETYFAKLNSSFYLQENISKNYESISQFGVGVFSYFLLCDSFDVETKSENSEAIKYRVTRNAESSFYFFDNASKDTTGTKITIYLNQKLDFSYLVEKIEHYFRFIDLNLILKDDSDGVYEISNKGFAIDKTKLISENVKILSQDKISELDIIESYLNTEYYEGQINLFVIKKEQIIDPISLYDILGNSYHTSYKLYQKGIYVTSIGNSILRNTIGEINTKSKLNLNISRNRFNNSETLKAIVANFENNLIDKVFSSWKNLPKEVKYLKSNMFISNYLSLYNIDEKTIELLKNNWFLKTYSSSGEDISSFSEILNLENF